MPIKTKVPIRRISQQEFGEISFEVMRHVFEIHNEIGQFFNEQIYKIELARRMPDVHLELPVEIVFDSFRKECFIDVLVGDGAIFEFKAVESLVRRHRAQILHYLMLGDAAHGKLINVRPTVVEHEFVNTRWTRADRVKFEVQCSNWNGALPGVELLREFLTAFLHDLGTGLRISLYEEAAAHCFGGASQVEAEATVRVNGTPIGHQPVRLIAPHVALKITAFESRLEHFEVQARKWLAHVDLLAIAWVNVGMKTVTFTTLEREM